MHIYIYMYVCGQEQLCVCILQYCLGKPALTSLLLCTLEALKCRVCQK